MMMNNILITVYLKTYLMGVSLKTTKKLFSLSGNQCMFENCGNIMYDEIEDTVIGEICHIRSPKSNGPRHVRVTKWLIQLET